MEMRVIKLSCRVKGIEMERVVEGDRDQCLLQVLARAGSISRDATLKRYAIAATFTSTRTPHTTHLHHDNLYSTSLNEYPRPANLPASGIML